MRIASTVAFVLAMSSASAQAQGQQWDDLYREAVAHVGRREWQPAEEKLLTAQKAGPPSGRGVIRRFLNRDDYFPEYYLGVVYLNTNRAQAALTQFKIARARGVDLKDSDFRGLPDLEKRALALIEADAEAKRKAVPDPKQVFANSMEQSKRLLGDNRFDDAEAAAQRARATNVDVAAADDMLRRIRQQRAAEQIRVQLSKSPSVSELRRMLQEYDDSGASLDEIRTRIADFEAAEIRATNERQAMVEFFNGSFQRSLNLLVEAEKAAALSARGQLYRAVSLASLALRGKGMNQGQLRSARRAWEEANKQADVFKADLTYISPEVIRLLEGK